MKPDLLILDEPALGLAPVVMEQLGEQNVTFALPHADRVYVLERGRINWVGGPGAFAAEAGARYL